MISPPPARRPSAVPTGVVLQRRPRLRCDRAAALLVSWLVAACGPNAPEMDPAGAVGTSTVVLVSLDGFRWDYLERGQSPNLSALEARGVRAEGLVPSFPTKTFPNHYTLVTGLLPDHHGIVANTFYDPDFDATFSMYDRATVQDARWWGGEPIWVTAERRGRATAPLFWPGSEAAIGGIRPSHWRPYDATMSHAERVHWVLERLELPEGERPVFATLYLADADEAGHSHGPESREVDAAIRRADDAVGLLLDGLTARNLTGIVNVVVVSDHGMIATSPERVIFLDDYVRPEEAHPVDWNPVLALWPADADRDAVLADLVGAHPEMAVWPRDKIPRRLRYGGSERVPPLLGLASPGWSITSHEYFDRQPGRFGGGNHGFDPAASGMRGIFVAAGPAFRRGTRVPAFANVHVYALLMHALGLPAVAGDGDLAAVPGVLAAR